MPEPKKSPTKRRQGNRRSHIGLKLARRINGRSPVKIFTTRRETPNLAKNAGTKAAKKVSAKPAAKKPTKAKAPAKKKTSTKKK